MEVDGSNAVQLTDTPGIEGMPDISPDGKWIVYQMSDEKRRLTLWKLPLDGGDPVQLTQAEASMPDISPDGRMIACRYEDPADGGRRKTALLPIDGGVPTQFIDQPDLNASPIFKWSSDGKSLIHIDARNRGFGLWTQPIDLGRRTLLAGSDEMRIFYFEVMPDGNGLILARGSETSDVILLNNFR
jgi:Tol biopolymer transport system component